MVENASKGYFKNLIDIQITNNRIAALQESNTDDSYRTNLNNQIVAKLQSICNDEENFPVLNKINLNNNGYNEYTIDDFRTTVGNACKDDNCSRHITINSRDTVPSIKPMCATNNVNTYWYYDMTEEKEVLQCRYTWNWEYDNQYGSTYATNDGPFPNSDTEEDSCNNAYIISSDH
jgi:hypothetical protein